MASRDAPPPDQQRITEPYDPRAGIRLSGWVALAAVAATLTGALLAPPDWPAGPGRVSLSYRETVVDSAAVEIGADPSVELEGRVGGISLAARFPEGVSNTEPIRATIAAARNDAALRPDLSDVTLQVTLADGSDELIPVLRWDPDDRVLEAVRRPPVRSGVVLGLLGLVIVLWITEAVPLFVTALIIPVVLVVGDVATAPDALAPFFHPIIALFFGGFMMAEAMRRVGLDHLAAISIVARAGRSPAALFGAMLGVSAFMSMWMSNTAATAVLLPIALAVTAPIAHLRYRKAMVLGIAYAATIGGVGSAIGTPANPLAIEFLDTFVGRQISFVGWFAFGLPMVVIFLPLMGLYLWRRSRVVVDRAAFERSRRAAAAELDQAGRPTRDQLVVLGVFAAVMAVWLTQTWNGLNTGIVAVAGVVVLAVLGKSRPEDLGRISWASLLTFGGGLTLGVFLVSSGTSDWLATRLEGISSVPSGIGVAAVALLALGLTTVASNTATAAMLVPLAIPLAGILGVDPVLLVVVVAIASSVDFALVIGTPPTMIAYSSRLFTTTEVFRTGIILDLAGIGLLVTVVSWLWDVVGLV